LKKRAPSIITEVLDVSTMEKTPVKSTYREELGSVSRTLEILAERVRELLKNRQLSIQAAERALMGELARVGLVVLGELLTGQDPGGEDVAVEGQRYWQAVRSKCEYMSSFGRVTVERGIYRSRRNGPTLCPMELRAGIVEGFWTPQAAKLAALCISDMTPYRAEGFFGEWGMMDPSRSSLDRLPKALGDRWEANREIYEERLRQSDQIPKEAVTVAVSLDGVMVPMRDSNKAARKAETRSEGRVDKGPAGYKEVACGTLSFYDAEGERLATRRMARMPEADKKTLKQQLSGELEHVLGQRPELVVVAVADGAANNWEYLHSLPCNHHVVDFYHAAEHLKRALDVCMGASTIATRSKFEQLRRTLRDEANGVDKVIGALKKLKPKKRGDHRDYRTGIAYFERHRTRMRYASLCRKHLPIGSGVIEGTCKSLASDRLKRAGMRWDAAGGQAVLNLRAWSQSDRFDAAWLLLQENYCADIPLAA
jgi:hypothetical protein